ncbi:MAG: polysaccharide biosynthesis/export family protein [Candidatus Cyclobacteriaceae bacterium M2_1C_046]
MTFKKLLIFNGFILLSFTSCVTNKQYAYFQKDDLYKQNVEDSVYRTYNLPDFEYKLRPYDILNIKFYSLTGEELNIFKREQMTDSRVMQGEAALLGGYLIDEYGKVSFPVVGKVELSGLSLSEAEEKLKNIAAIYLEEPVVEVKLLNYRFTLLGEVNNEGVQSTFNYAITIPEAIGMAGGLSDLADRGNLKIIRKINEKNVIFYVNLLEEDFFNNSKFYIHPNDVIVVPPLKQRPFRKYFTQNLAVFNSSISVILVGLNLYLLLSSDSNN